MSAAVERSLTSQSPAITVAGAGLEEGPGEADQPFAGVDPGARSAAGGDSDQAGAQGQGRPLRGRRACSSPLAGQDDRGFQRVFAIGRGVGREVDEREAAGVGFAIGGGEAAAPVRTRLDGPGNLRRRLSTSLAASGSGGYSAAAGMGLPIRSRESPFAPLGRSCWIEERERRHDGQRYLFQPVMGPSGRRGQRPRGSARAARHPAPGPPSIRQGPAARAGPAAAPRADAQPGLAVSSDREALDGSRIGFKTAALNSASPGSRRTSIRRGVTTQAKDRWGPSHTETSVAPSAAGHLTEARKRRRMQCGFQQAQLLGEHPGARRLDDLERAFAAAAVHQEADVIPIQPLGTRMEAEFPLVPSERLAGSLEGGQAGLVLQVGLRPALAVCIEVAERGVGFPTACRSWRSAPEAAASRKPRRRRRYLLWRPEFPPGGREPKAPGWGPGFGGSTRAPPGCSLRRRLDLRGQRDLGQAFQPACRRKPALPSWRAPESACW